MFSRKIEENDVVLSGAEFARLMHENGETVQPSQFREKLVFDFGKRTWLPVTKEELKKDFYTQLIVGKGKDGNGEGRGYTRYHRANHQIYKLQRDPSLDSTRPSKPLVWSGTEPVSFFLFPEEFVPAFTATLEKKLVKVIQVKETEAPALETQETTQAEQKISIKKRGPYKKRLKDVNSFTITIKGGDIEATVKGSDKTKLVKRVRDIINS